MDYYSEHIIAAALTASQVQSSHKLKSHFPDWKKMWLLTHAHTHSAWERERDAYRYTQHNFILQLLSALKVAFAVKVNNELSNEN